MCHPFRLNPEVRWSRCHCCFIFASDAFPHYIASRQFHQHLSEVLALEELEEGCRRIFDALLDALFPRSSGSAAVNRSAESPIAVAPRLAASNNGGCVGLLDVNTPI